MLSGETKEIFIGWGAFCTVVMAFMMFLKWLGTGSFDGELDFGYVTAPLLVMAIGYFAPLREE